MLKMRLQRIGRKNDASFRVIITDSRRGPKSGKHIDLLGSYNPKMNQISIDGEKAKKWIANGVQVSDTVHNLLISQKIIEGKKINVLPKKSPIVKESEETEVVEKTVEANEASASEAGVTEAKSEKSAPVVTAEVREESTEEKIEEKKEVPPDTEETETTTDKKEAAGESEDKESEEKPAEKTDS